MNRGSVIRSVFLVVLVVILDIFPFRNPAFAQTYNFTHYDIEDGLVQSQAYRLYQDRSHFLWIGTVAGVSRFDGKEFISIAKSDGLLGSNVASILQDKKGITWLGTEDYLSYIRNNKIMSIPVKSPSLDKRVRTLREDKEGLIWGISGNKLFYIKDLKSYRTEIGHNKNYVSAISTDADGNLLAVTVDGIYKRLGGKWVFQIAIPDNDKIFLNRIIRDRYARDTYYLLGPTELLVYKNNTITPFRNPLLEEAIKYNLVCLEQDADGNLWVGTGRGAFYLSPTNPIHFTAANGFTDNMVPDILKDAENNIWLGSDGSGVYKYHGAYYTSYNRINDDNTPIIMGMAQDSQNNVWMGTFNQGLIRYNGTTFNTVRIPTPISSRINTIYCDKDNKTLIGVAYGGIWEYDGKSFTRIVPEGQRPFVAFSILRDSNKTLWIGGPSGFFYSVMPGKVMQIEGINSTVSSIAELGKDSVLIGHSTGINLIRNKKIDPSFHIPKLENTNVLCLIKYKNLVIIGTSGDGLYIYDRKTRNLKNYTKYHGLYSNDIYSLIEDNFGVIWAGTGRGVNKFRVNPESMNISVIRENGARALVECNQNSIMKRGNEIWVGTTKGIYIYKSDFKFPFQQKPFVNINSIKVSHTDGKLDEDQPLLLPGLWLPDDLKIKSKNKGIAISFQGIYFTNPDDIRYQYRLQGIDKEFSTPAKANLIEYSSLSPGKYTFEVRAITGSGLTSDVKTVAFEIIPTVFQTAWFKLLSILIITGLIILLQSYLVKQKRKKKDELRKIKHEEQLKIRRQTAEDFHDDIGNKLTRISVLSDILETKIEGQDPDQKQLVKQIKENAAIVYNGTKDVLWALDPKSDNLYEILDHVKHFGNEFFENTGIAFTFYAFDEARYKKIDLPMEYSRNMSMIFKELFNNIMKHAQAKNVSVSGYEQGKDICLQINDDGRGFDKESPSLGRGLNNMQVRAGRINAGLDVETYPGKGTKVIFILRGCNI